MSLHRSLLIALLLSPIACGGAPATHQEPTQIDEGSAKPSAKPQAPLPEAFRHQVTPMVGAAILRYLPEDSVAAVLVKSPGELAKSIESTAIFRDYKEFHHQASRQLSTRAGANLLEVETWPQIGIDIAAPAGVALLLEDGSVGVFFVTLSDRAAFLEGMSELARNQGLPAPVRAELDDGFALQVSNDLALIVRENTAMVAVAQRSRDLPGVIALLSGASELQSLDESGRIAETFAGFDYGEDVAGFLAFDSMATKVLAALDKNSSTSYYAEEVDRLEERVEQAKAEGRETDSIEVLEADLRQALSEHARYELRRTSERRLLSDLIGPLGPVAFGIDLEGASTRARAQLHPQPNSLPARLLANTQRPPELSTRLTELPLFMLGGQVDTEAGNALFDLLLHVDGTTRNGLAAEFKNMYGLPLKRILDHLSGEVSGALTINRGMMKTDAVPMRDALGMHLLFGLDDLDASRALLHEVAGLPKVREYVVGAGETLALEIPGFNARVLRIEIIDGFLQARSLGPAEGEAAFSRAERELLVTESAAAMAVDPLLLSWLGLRKYDDSSSYYSTRGPSDPATVKRREEILAEKEQVRARLALLRSQRLLSSAKQVGHLVVGVRHYDGGYALLASIEGESANLARGLQRIFEDLDTRAETARLGKPSAIGELEAKLDALEDELWQLRSSQP